MRVPLPLEAKRTGGNRPSGKPDIRCQENHDNSRRIKEILSPRTLLLNPLLLRTLQLVAVPAVILLAAALAVVTSQKLPRSLSGLIGVGPYIVLPWGRQSARVQPQPRSDHAGLASRRLRRLQPGLDLGPQSFALRAC